MQLSSLSLLQGAVVFTCFLAVHFGETLVMARVFVEYGIWKCLDLVKIFIAFLLGYKFHTLPRHIFLSQRSSAAGNSSEK